MRSSFQMACTNVHVPYNKNNKFTSKPVKQYKLVGVMPLVWCKHITLYDNHKINNFLKLTQK